MAILERLVADLAISHRDWASASSRDWLRIWLARLFPKRNYFPLSAPMDALTDQGIAGKSLPEAALLDDDVDINVSGQDIYGEDFDTPEIERLREVRLPMVALLMISLIWIGWRRMRHDFQCQRAPARLYFQTGDRR